MSGGHSSSGYDWVRGDKAASEWVRHTLTQAGSMPIELKIDENFVIGRSRDCDLTVPSQRISRRHSEIFWRDKEPRIRDLGSQNGTKIGGKRITREHILVDGDEITVGPFLVTYRRTENAASDSALMGDTDGLTQPMMSDALAGSLEQMSPFELLQTLEFNQKTGTLNVFGDRGDCRMVVNNGRPVFGKLGELMGSEAVVTMVTWTEGHFSFSPVIEDEEVNISTTITNLLLEAGRRIDEQSAG